MNKKEEILRMAYFQGLQETVVPSGKRVKRVKKTTRSCKGCTFETEIGCFCSPDEMWIKI